MTNVLTRAKKTGNQYGLPLVAPVTQTIIPVIDKVGSRFLGFFTIASTQFTAPGAVTLPGNAVPINVVTVTPPVKFGDGYDHGMGVPQFMAAVYDYAELRSQPWAAYTSFIDANDTGYFSNYAMPTQGWVYTLGRGTLYKSLQVGMASVPTVAQAPTTPTNPVVTDADMRWAASLNLSTSDIGCQFFDFNWVTLFQAKLPTNSPFRNDVSPLRIETVSNPAGGDFKATFISDKGQAVLPGGGIMFNSIRVVRLGDAEPGDYDFVFKVTNTNNLSTNVTLTLTVV